MTLIANTNGTLDVVNGQLKDKYSNGIWQNPYQQFTTLAVASSINYYELSYGAVRLPSNLWLSNMAGEVSSIQFNADDGQGYQTVQMDANIPFNYADTGWKHWVFRVNLTGGQQLYTHTKIHITNTSNLAGSGGNNVAQRGTNLRRATVSATKAYNGVFGTARILISYRNDNDPVIRKPLIVAEGLDIGHITKPENPEGANTYVEFIDRIRESGSPALDLLLRNGANSEYDIIYVNWTNGTDYLQRNAYVLEAVIKWVNDRKQPLPGNSVAEKNVVMGLSMGGVVARMALGDLERNGPYAHDTRLYVSLDGPQQGSHIPLGLQAAARHALQMYLRTGHYSLVAEGIVPVVANGLSISKALRILDRPGPKQLLKHQIDVNYNFNINEHEQFLLELRTSWGYPTSTRNIVISNGSECAVDQEFAAGGNLLYLDRNIKTRFLGDIVLMIASPIAHVLSGGLINFAPFLIPGSQEFNAKFDIKALATGGGNQVYYGRVKYTKKILWLLPVTITIGEKTYNAPSGLLAFDNYPGSFYILSMKKELNAVSHDGLFNYDNTFQVQRRFTHVLTTSALDIGGGGTALTTTQYYAKYVGETPPAAPYNVPSAIANFTTAYNQPPLLVQGPTNPSTGLPAYEFISNGSEYHTRFYLRNANWLAAELNGTTTVRTNCSAFCGLLIDGPNAICDNGSFSVPAIAGATYTWSVNNTFLINTAPSGNTIAISRRRPGTANITVTVQINGSQCGTATLSKTFQFGATSSLIIGPYDVDEHTVMGVAYTNTPYYFTPYESSVHFPALSYTWTLFPPTGNPTLYSGSQPYITFTEEGLHTLQLQKTTECGVVTSSVVLNVQLNQSGFLLMAAPNPVTGDVMNISIEQENAQLKSLPADGETFVELYHFNSAMKIREWKFKNSQRQFQLDVRGIAKGKYIVRVRKGNVQQSKQILIN